jgi:ribonuclease R
MLRGLADEGVVDSRRKKLHRAGTLPHVLMAEITVRDRDGELIAVPSEWDDEAHGDAPKIHLPFARRIGEPPASATACCRVEIRYRRRCGPL